VSFPLFGCVVFAPVLKLGLVDFQINLHHAQLQSLLHLGHRQVVNDGANFFDEKAQQRAGADVADLFIPIFQKIALNRGNRLLPGLLRYLNAHLMNPSVTKTRRGSSLPWHRLFGITSFELG
jgi:hypothetical protein